MEAQRRLRQKRYGARSKIKKENKLPRDVSFMVQEDIDLLQEQGVSHELLALLARRADLREPDHVREEAPGPVQDMPHEDDPPPSPVEDDPAAPPDSPGHSTERDEQGEFTK